MCIAPTLLSGSKHPPNTCSQIAAVTTFTADSLSCEKKKKVEETDLGFCLFKKSYKNMFL